MKILISLLCEAQKRKKWNIHKEIWADVEPKNEIDNGRYLDYKEMGAQP